MAQANVNIRMDTDLKQDFERLCRDIGLSVTTAFTIFAKQSVREHRLPVSLEADPFYSEANMAHIDRAIARLEAGLGTEHELIEADE